jgi:hypothetical protein
MFGRFNADEEENFGGGFEPIPAGNYTVIIDNTEVKPTKKGGVGINLTYKVVEGSYKNRLIFDWLNYECPSSEIAQKIGRGDLKKICEAVGKPVIDDPSELKYKPFGISVKVVKDDYKDDGSFKNERNSILAMKPGAKREVVGVTAGDSGPPSNTSTAVESVDEEDIPF